MWSYVHRRVFRTKSNIYNGTFFTSGKLYFKNVVNSIELPLGSMFYTTHPFEKKLTTVKKPLVNNGTMLKKMNKGFLN